MDLGIAGKTALVTGSSAGLGLGVARALSREGCAVAINSRRRDVLEGVAADLPGEAVPLPGDVTDPEAPARLVAATVERFGRLDILVANTPGPPSARALDVEDADMHAALQANLLTSIRLVQEAVPHMRANGWGRIVLNTSVAVKEPIPTLAYSNTARTGLWAWAKTAAADLIDDGITLNLVCPGSHDTDRARALGLTGRMGDPDDFGRIVAFLCSDAAGFVSGAALQVDGAGISGLL
jgi:3-oxoacyl-[acyl-carrier protein] reductase